MRGFRVLGHGIREEPGMFIYGVLGSALFALMTVASSYVIGAVVGRVAEPALASGRIVVGSLALGAGAILAVSALKVMGIFGRRLGAGRMNFNLQARYRRRVTRRYLDLPVSWHQEHATGTLLSNANADVEAIWSPIQPFPLAVGAIVMLVASLASLFIVDWALALVGVALFPLLYLASVFFSRFVAPRMARSQQLRAELSATAHESFDGALVIKTMGREADETERFGAKATELRDAMVSLGRVRGLFDPFLDGLPSLGTLAVLVVGAIRLKQGVIDLGDVVSVSFLFVMLGLPVQAVGWVLAELPRAVVGWDRVQHVITAAGDMTYGQRSFDGTGPAALSFSDVAFAHTAEGPVLSGVSFEVAAGRTVALVGPTGSGKSTIGTLAARLVDPAAGTVRLDGVDVRELSAGALASTVALVPQIPFVFDDTIRGNVTLDRDGIGDDQVWEALRAAQADGYTAALPTSLSTVVGERGTSLSGGQRQRLTLARALAGKPRLLILDDATSAVDPSVEAAILGALRRTGRSILVVAYRRATIALADEVVYLEGGRVVARGTHAELLDTVPGYAELVTAYEHDHDHVDQAEATR
jgi:ABC-type multidrug transport system fused ATPase/permease subunit